MNPSSSDGYLLPQCVPLQPLRNLQLQQSKESKQKADLNQARFFDG